MYISWKLDATNIYFSIVKAENLDFEVVLQNSVSSLLILYWLYLLWMPYFTYCWCILRWCKWRKLIPVNIQPCKLLAIFCSLNSSVSVNMNHTCTPTSYSDHQLADVLTRPIVAPSDYQCPSSGRRKKMCKDKINFDLHTHVDALLVVIKEFTHKLI